LLFRGDVAFDFHSAYDELNADDQDYRFYAALARELHTRSVLDLGCGTGTLARLLAQDGNDVVAIDPDPDMLRVARAKPGADEVDWRLGYSDSADPASVDLAVMSGHVAQLFLTEETWDATLRDLRLAVKPGGTLAFETRNPGARGWERWTRGSTLRTITTDDGPVEYWHETVEVVLPHVVYETYTRSLSNGRQTRERNILAFRDPNTLRDSLQRAGFTVASMLGDWSGAPLSGESPELIVLAR
jgi:SAM-dependent methyltransferase